MPYGVEIFNNNNYILIDGTYMNYSVAQQGSSSTSGAWKEITTPSLTRPPIVGITSAPSAHVGVGGFGKTGSNFTSTWFGAEVYFSAGSYHNRTTTFEYLIFAPSDHITSPTDPYGLAIYNAAGELIIHSGGRYLRIIDIVEFSVSTYGSFKTLTHASVTNPMYILDGINIGSWFYKYGIKTISSTQCSVGPCGSQYVGSAVYVPFWGYNSTQRLIVCEKPAA